MALVPAWNFGGQQYNYEWMYWRGYEAAQAAGQGDAYIAEGQNVGSQGLDAGPLQQQYLDQARQMIQSGQWQNPGSAPPPGAAPAQPAQPAGTPATPAPGGQAGAPTPPAGPPIVPQPPPQPAPTPLPTAPAGVTQTVPGGGFTRTIYTPSGPATFWFAGGNVPGDIAEWYFRSDSPGGMSTAGPPPPEAVERFRNYVRSGSIVPLDDGAKNFSLSQGGLQAGDIPPVPGINAPMIGGEPGGLGVEWWTVAFQKAKQESDAAVAEAVARGYFGATPPRIDPATGQYDLNDPNLTLQARATLANIVTETTQTSIAGQLADNTVKQTEAQIRQQDIALQQNQQQLDEARRSGDLNRAQQLELQGRQLQFERDRLAQQVQEYQQTYKLQEAAITGTYGGSPTLQRIQQEADIRQRQEQLDASIRQADTQLAQRQQEIDNAFRAGDLDRAQQLQIEQGRQQLERDRMAQQSEQFRVTSGQTQQSLDAQIRQKDTELQQNQQALNEAIRNNDLNRAQQLEVQARQLQFERQQLAQQAEQFRVTAGQSQQALDAQIRQADAGIALRQQELTEAVRNNDLNRQQELTLQINQLTYLREQWAQQLQLERQKLGQQQQQFEVEQTGYVGGQATLQRQQVEAQIRQAQEQLRIAEQQGNADLALRERQRLDQLEAQRGQLDLQRAQVSGYIGGEATLERQRVEAEITNAQERLRVAEELGQGDLALRERERIDKLQIVAAQLSQQESEFGRTFGIQQGALTGTYGGQQTLDAQKFAAEQQQLAYQRAANPARAFENELARGSGGNAWNPATGTASMVGQFGQFGQFGQAGTQQQAGQPQNEPLVRVPAIVNAFAGGQYVPTAGQFGVPNTLATAGRAALSTQDFQQQNLPQTLKMSPTQQMVVQSFGQAGGVSADEQDYWRNAGLRKTQPTGGTQASYAGF